MKEILIHKDMKDIESIWQEELGRELRRRFELDQNAIKENNSDCYKRIAFDNYLWLKEIVDKMGWLSWDEAGIAGETCAWLIVQHSDNDVKFQKKCLKLIEKLPLTRERKGYIAYLTDRILINLGKKQIYGTQFRNGEAYPIENDEGLEERRKQMGLENFADYKRKISSLISS